MITISGLTYGRHFDEGGIRTIPQTTYWFYLRGIVVYSEEEYEVLYLRDELQEVRLRSELDSIVSRLRGGSKEQEETSFPFGGFHGSVRCFDNATLLHFPLNGEGVAVSLDPDAARDLNTFAGDCLEQIHETPPI